jgi:hypothetical protein
VLGPEVEIHRTLGDFRIRENVVEADKAIRPVSELMRGGAQDL